MERLLPIEYPEQLPVSARRAEIADAIARHQVVIVAGETGSGKTTQLPKICVELGRGVRGRIGHTQPRRLAARTVAERIAAELGAELGSVVGYAIRHSDSVGEATAIKVMTDGILLAETGRDPNLLAYDTIIIDEAHERGLNIDFLIGYLKQLLPRRPDLKLIITSATIDSGKFSRHFGNSSGLDGAPVIEVSGRTYPVEIRYRPLVDPDAAATAPQTTTEPQTAAERDQAQGICDAVSELTAEGPGDILVFLSGEREIRDAADALTALKLLATEVVPLFARLSVADQHRVFSPHPGRRIVLATNVAETSLTVPGIRYVVDAGTARISRFSNRTKVQRLPIEKVSQASANQRAGRCGRVADGICIRLYTAADFEQRPEFIDPEVLRTNLASVILRMAALRLGDIEDFPFLDPPDRHAIASGVQLLAELGALADSSPKSDATDGTRNSAAGRRLTGIGHKLARLPVDPRFGRMVLAAGHYECVREVLIIVAGMSIQDPRERPAEQQQAAATQHARFDDPTSELLAYLNLWNQLSASRAQLSNSRFRKLCKAQFLHYLRFREWEDVFAQLSGVAAELGLQVSEQSAPPQQIHRALLAGLLSHIGRYDGATREYQGARGTRFALPRGCALAKKPPLWVMAAQLMETNRLWARSVAAIDPEWIETLAGHLVKRQYSEPHWSSKRAAVMGYERVTLYGLPVVTRRPVNYATIDAPLARELFIRHALVEGDWNTHHEFFHTNRRLLEQAEELEERARRRGLVVGDDVLFDFYDARIGPEVVSGRHFDSWWKQTRRTDPGRLSFDPKLLRDPDVDVDAGDFPLVWSSSTGPELPMTYVFSPGQADDGVTVDLPLTALGELHSDGLAWQVPGLRREIVTTLLRSLPKPMRRSFVPIPDCVSSLLELLPDEPGAVLRTVATQLSAASGNPISAETWDLDSFPGHLRTTFRVLDEDGIVLAHGKDPDALRVQLRDRLGEVLNEALAQTHTSGIERAGLQRWDFGDLPQHIEHERA
ncbi:MAG: ATP-dependent RNA helicase HrpA, partial [Mycobacteriales bacterium]